MTHEHDEMPPAVPNGFDAAIVLLKMAADPAALQLALDQLMAAGMKAKEIEASARRAVVAMQNREAELEARAAEIDAARTLYAERLTVLDGRLATLKEREAEAADHERRLKIRMLQFYHLPQPSALQSLPTFAAIEDEVRGAPDIHFDPVNLAGDETVPVQHTPVGSSLRRSQARRANAN